MSAPSPSASARPPSPGSCVGPPIRGSIGLSPHAFRPWSGVRRRSDTEAMTTTTAPTHEAVDVVARDGTALRLRPIRPDDAEALVAFHGRLSSETTYYRFFSVHPWLSPREVDWFTHVDDHDRVALVALDCDRIVAVGRYDRMPRSPMAEVAFVVEDAYQRQGICTLLLERLAE